MTKDHRRVDAGTAQVILLDDRGFLREIAERVVQQILEAEMTEHIGAARTNAARLAPFTATATGRGLFAPG